MFKTKLERFIIKRALIFFIILTILDIIFVDTRFLTFVGLTIGSVFSISKITSYIFVFSSASNPNSNSALVVVKSIFIFVLTHMIVLILMFIAYKIDVWFFTGIVAGVLLVPAVIFFNSITEVLRITHNNFE